MKKQKKFNYDFIIIALCALIFVLGSGLWGSRSLVVVPITTALDISRTAYSFTNTIRAATVSIATLFFAFFIDKLGSKKMLCIGFVGYFFAALLYALAESIALLYLSAFILGLAFSWTGTPIVSYIINKICKKNQGAILAGVLSGSALGSVIFTRIVTPFISDNSNPFGYRNAYFIMAGISVVMFFLLLFLFKEPKTDEEVYAKQGKKARGKNWVGIEYAQALKKPYFYGLCVCVFLSGVVLSGLSDLYAAHMSDRGINVDTIALVASISAIVILVFKLMAGIIYDHAGLRVTITISSLSAILAVLCLLFVGNTSIGILFAMLFIVFRPIAMPMELFIVPIYAKDLFGEKSFQKVVGIFASITQVGIAVASPIVNAFYDFAGSYDWALLLCAGFMLFTFIALQFIISAAHRVRKQVENGELLAQESII